MVARCATRAVAPTASHNSPLRNLETGIQRGARFADSHSVGGHSGGAVLFAIFDGSPVTAMVNYRQRKSALASLCSFEHRIISCVIELPFRNRALSAPENASLDLVRPLRSLRGTVRVHRIPIW